MLCVFWPFYFLTKNYASLRRVSRVIVELSELRVTPGNWQIGWSCSPQGLSNIRGKLYSSTLNREVKLGNRFCIDFQRVYADKHLQRSDVEKWENMFFFFFFGIKRWQSLFRIKWNVSSSTNELLRYTYDLWKTKQNIDKKISCYY